MTDNTPMRSVASVPCKEKVEAKVCRMARKASRLPSSYVLGHFCGDGIQSSVVGLERRGGAGPAQHSAEKATLNQKGGNRPTNLTVTSMFNCATSRKKSHISGLTRQRRPMLDGFWGGMFSNF